MTITHAVDILLSNLPPEACLVYQLPGLVNNLLSIAILCYTGCEVFFHKTGREVTLDGTTILRGWCDPTNCLRHVMIVNDGWTTKLTIRDITRPIIPLSTTPTGHLANSMPIVPPESNTTLANSLYECSNMGQLTNYYYVCLNYPVKSTLAKAIDRGYLKGWWGLTSQRTRCHISVSTESEMDTWINNAKGSNPLNPLQQPCHFRFPTSLTTLWRMSLRNPTMPALTLSSWSSTKSMATSLPIKWAASLSHQTRPRICCSILHL
jgi:hypothetical protein